MGSLAPLFAAHEIDMEVLPMLTGEDLSDMGLTDFTTRIELLIHVTAECNARAVAEVNAELAVMTEREGEALAGVRGEALEGEAEGADDDDADGGAGNGAEAVEDCAEQQGKEAHTAVVAPDVVPADTLDTLPEAAPDGVEDAAPGDALGAAPAAAPTACAQDAPDVPMVDSEHAAELTVDEPVECVASVAAGSGAEPPAPEADLEAAPAGALEA